MPATQVNLKESTQELIADLVETTIVMRTFTTSSKSMVKMLLRIAMKITVSMVMSIPTKQLMLLLRVGVENIGNFQDAYYGEYELPKSLLRTM